MEGIAVCCWSTRWLCQHSFWTFLATGSLSRRVPVVFILTLYPTPSHRMIMPESLNHLNVWEVRMIQAGTWRIQHPHGKQKDSSLWVTLFDTVMTENGILLNPYDFDVNNIAHTLYSLLFDYAVLSFCVCWLILERLTCARILILQVVGMLCGWSDC